MKPQENNTVRVDVAIIDKALTTTSSKLMVILLVIIGFITINQTAMAQTTPNVEPCPCSALYPGYYYTGQYYPYKPVLFTYMPYDIMIGYVLMDSIMAHGKDSFPTALAQENFIKSLTCTGDTLGYALKYLYRLADYNPFLYYNFLTSYQQGKQQPMSLLPALLNHVGKECGLPKQQVVKAEYILHINVNVTENFDYESMPNDYTHLLYAYCNVVDTIKGQVLPNISNTIKVFKQDSAGISVKRATSLAVPQNTNFIFYYNRGWAPRKVESNKEYIIFSYNLGACIGTTGQYYEIRPTFLGGSNGMFPIIGGNVIDEDNDFGWGTSVPLDVFKQNLQALIDSIKNYGE